MLGAIIGDIAGSIFEGRNANNYSTKLFTQNNRFTDDTVCTIAISRICYWLSQEDKSKKLLEDNTLLSRQLQGWCRKHPHRGYGAMFKEWIYSDGHNQYDSFANGSIMRISPVAYISDYDMAISLAEKITALTHKHPESINGSKCIVECIYKLRQSKDLSLDDKKNLIKNIMHDKYSYPISSMNYYREQSGFWIKTIEMIPVVLSILLESNSFEACIRNAIWIGGDTDTLCAVVGSVAEALYGANDEEFIALSEKALSYLDLESIIVLNEFVKTYYENDSKISKLVNHICNIKEEEKIENNDLSRFENAQLEHFHNIEKELQNGSKRTHWMWFAFPQIKGLGFSKMSRYYSIQSKKEAEEYISHPILSKNLKTLCNILLNQTKKGKKLLNILNNNVDLMKLYSSMTLFSQVSNELKDIELYTSLLKIAQLELGIDKNFIGEPYTLDSINPVLDMHPISWTSSTK